MPGLQRSLARILYGHRYDHVPIGVRVYLRPGDRLVRRAQGTWRRLRSRVVTLAEYRAAIAPSEIEEFLTCTLCGESRQRPMYRPGGKGKWSYHVVECPRCGFLYRNPNVRPERLGDLYATGYSRFLTGEYSRNRQLRYRLVMASMSPIMDAGQGRRLLDFGCGAGLFLEVAQERRFDCYGVDLSPDSVQAARKRLNNDNVFFGSPKDIPEIASGGFDIITMWSVLAHLPRPVDDLSMLRSLLRPDGVLVILTVNAGSLLLHGNGDKWSGFTPNHLMFYRRATLPRLLAKAGFAGVRYFSHYGDEAEAGTSGLTHKELARLRRRVDATDGGNMMRAVAFASEAAIQRWAEDRRDVVAIRSAHDIAPTTHARPPRSHGIPDPANSAPSDQAVRSD
jgi:SAM-dependent methyltransferase